MRKFISKIPLNSISFKLTAGVFAVLLPLIFLLIYNNIYSIKVIHNQVAESYKNLLTLYMRQIDDSLDAADENMAYMAALDNDLKLIGADIDPNYRSLAQIKVSNRLSENIGSYKAIDVVFVYNTISKEFLYALNYKNDFEEREIVKKYIINLLDKSTQSDDLNVKKWTPVKIDGQFYLIKIFKAGDSYIGAWVNTKRLLIPLGLINLGEGGKSALTSSEGTIMASSVETNNIDIDLTGDLQNYYITGDKNKYIVVGENSTKGDFNLVAVIPDEEILEKLPYLKNIINIIAFASILLLPLCLVFLRKVVLIPINRMMTAMKKIRDGNIEVRIKNYKTSDEFQIAYDTFNKMVDQIHDLKISIYEEQLSKQKAELKHLQLQVNPHFFLNSLNIIYRMAQTGKYELIKEMALCLLQYFRYMFRENSGFVFLKDELKHVKNYIHIQELRFPESLNYNIEVPEFILNTPVPPLIIQNFVENSIKYAVTLDEPLHILIKADFVKEKGQDKLEIIIQDTGKGFPEEILKQIQAGQRVISKDGEHIGIWNVQRRLQLLYKGSASIEFSNGNQKGAIIKITLPLQPEI
ncbi:histidine kinase [Clostridium sp. SYSU_GA19001]|uniref:sensor histidine kinase n=1 Tax=Clostridium caldaquaticum TaxID=2940653 RepID=UPI0020771094|nr:histidine kinase [Clostridium caldaquaticum]MCM8709908.1 histidine kinase [Clostridium caldaquaticum]